MKRWRQIKVGDVVRIKKNEPIPADILMMSSSNPSGGCFIETSSLDGEVPTLSFSSLKEFILIVHFVK